MKKALLLLVVAVLTLGLVGGCLELKTYGNEGRTVDIGVGQEFIIELDSNPSTGYGWQASYDATMLELVGGEPTYEADEAEGAVVGGGGTELFRFKALESGVAQITLTYAQPWEGGDVAEPQLFTVNID
jgi:inhibitor of cysteine peptidase